MLVVLLGAPGTGKGTQARLLAEKYNLSILSTGEILRNAINKKTKLGLQIKEVMNSGGLVPDDMVSPLIENELKKKASNNGYILDGFPRTLAQAHTLDDIIINNNIDKFYVISLSLGEKEIVNRLSARMFCQRCNQSYNTITKHSKIKGKCDICGHTHFYTREDDKEKSINTRLSLYATQTSILTDYYKTYKNYVSIDANQDIEQIHKQITSLMEQLF